jgi:UDP-glucose 4-epimerase
MNGNLRRGRMQQTLNCVHRGLVSSNRETVLARTCVDLLPNIPSVLDVGCGNDFIRRLRKDSTQLTILCDGSQSKSYIYIDVVLVVIFISGSKSKEKCDYYYVTTGDYISVREIAELVIEGMGLKNVDLEFTGGDRGWKGNVPVVRFDISKITRTGWHANYTSRQLC